jgi:D-alanyl-lipoteichoic acid acyltransferase DltB (MBOAT superfamily)
LTDPVARRRLITASIIANLGFLGAFKYFNFFVGSLDALLTTTGLGHLSCAMRVVVPVGISFYTFQSMSYTIDIYRQVHRPARSFLDFALYVAFFPHLVAGPIQRYGLLEQIQRKRTVTGEQISSGCTLILLGFLRKVAIADAVAPYVAEIFADPAQQTSLSLLLGLYLFALQIYGDFAGYSDIARGVSRLMGIELMVNFRQPYLAADITEFWRCWHISLSTWLRDYLYIPLGGSRGGRLRTYRNLMLTMLLGGLWHGAAWTFVIWGGLHGLYLAAHKWLRGAGEAAEPAGAMRTPVVAIAHAGRVILTFHLVCLTWLFFRADSLGSAGRYLQGLARGTWRCDRRTMVVFLGYAGLLLAVDLVCRAQEGGFRWSQRVPWPVRGAAYAAVAAIITFVGSSNVEPFIYFQF